MAVFEGNFQQTESLRFALIIARFNDLVTLKLVEGCKDCLKRHGINPDPEGEQVDYVWVPGSFEDAKSGDAASMTRLQTPVSAFMCG
ncbi:MAG: 6,7-dimethyl-8-ribityllumazine synthase, partial [Dolichospermum sp.]